MLSSLKKKEGKQPAAIPHYAPHGTITPTHQKQSRKVTYMDEIKEDPQEAPQQQGLVPLKPLNRPLNIEVAAAHSKDDENKEKLAETKQDKSVTIAALEDALNKESTDWMRISEIQELFGSRLTQQQQQVFDEVESNYQNRSNEIEMLIEQATLEQEALSGAPSLQFSNTTILKSSPKSKTACSIPVSSYDMLLDKLLFGLPKNLPSIIVYVFDGTFSKDIQTVAQKEAAVREQFKELGTIKTVTHRGIVNYVTTFDEWKNQSARVKVFAAQRRPQTLTFFITDENGQQKESFARYCIKEEATNKSVPKLVTSQ